MSIARVSWYDVMRQKGDYMEETEVTADDVAEIRPVAEQFVESAERFLLGGN